MALPRWKPSDPVSVTRKQASQAWVLFGLGIASAGQASRKGRDPTVHRASITVSLVPLKTRA